MDPREARAVEAALTEAASAAGVTIEQIGLVDGIYFEIDEDDDTFTLTFGEQGDETFDDVDEAIARIEEYGEDVGGDGSKPGAIIVLVRKLNQLVARAPKMKKLEALWDREGKVRAIAIKLGFEWSRKMIANGDVTIYAEDNQLGFYTDHNDTVWVVTVDGEVDYELYVEE